MLYYVILCYCMCFHLLLIVSAYKACFEWSGSEFFDPMFVCVLISFGWLIISAQALWNERGVPLFL
jgi:hypothetical protein